MKAQLFYTGILFLCLSFPAFGQEPMTNSNEAPHSVLPADGVIEYLPKDSAYFQDDVKLSTGKISFDPSVYFFFRPESTINYKEAGIA